MSVTVELGSVEVIASANDTRVELESSISIQGSPSALDESEQGQPSTVYIAPVSDPATWIRKGHDYRVRLQIAIEEVASSGTHEAIVQTIADRLRASKYWGDCGLAVTTVEVTEGNDAVLVLGLDYGGKVDSATTAGLHRLGADVPFQDIQPPSGISCYDVAEVHFRVKISRPWLDPSIVSAPTVPYPNYEIVESRDGATAEAETQLRSGLGQDVIYPSPPPSQEDSTRLKYCDHSGLLMKLLQLALRTAIIGHPSRNPSRMSIASLSGLRPLASLAPALWLPGHLKAVASHTVFLPTISHALANVSRHAAKRMALHAKAVEAARRQNNYLLGTSHSSAVDDTISCQHSLEVLAWEEMAAVLPTVRLRKGAFNLLPESSEHVGDSDLSESILGQEFGQASFEQGALEDLDEDESYESDGDGILFDEDSFLEDDEDDEDGLCDLLLDDSPSTDTEDKFQCHTILGTEDTTRDSQADALWALDDVDEDMFADEPDNDPEPSPTAASADREYDATMLDT